MYLSKSKYVTFCGCAKKVWLDKYKSKEKYVSDSARMRMETGHDVGDLAKNYFGSYVEATELKADGTLDYNKMIDNTRRFVDEGQDNIAEAAFSYNDIYCAVDILHKETNGYSIYEVKSVTKPEQHFSYILDVSCQRYVLEHCGLTIVKTYIVYINSEYVRHGDIDVKKLFALYDCTDAVLEEIKNVENNIAAAKTVLSSTIEPDVPLCSEFCGAPKNCEYWEYCTRNLPKPSVFDLYNVRSRTKNKYYYYAHGIISYEDLLKTGDFNGIQKMQMEHSLYECQPHIDKQGIRDFLATLSYPLFFLDFETMQQTIPELEGARPNQQIPFQYSLHYIEKKGGPVLHKEFLAVSGEDPRRKIAENLVMDIPQNVCVLAYNMSFECGRLKELAELFPDLAEHLLNIESNVKDLLDPFKAGYYYTRDMGGSFSIKSVLPALFPNNPALDYHRLEGVHNGDEAKDFFPKIKDLPTEEQENARLCLLEYCKLDTYAMVVVWQELLIASMEGNI